jgi:hypothetical protein
MGSHNRHFVISAGIFSTVEKCAKPLPTASDRVPKVRHGTIRKALRPDTGRT